MSIFKVTIHLRHKNLDKTIKYENEIKRLENDILFLHETPTKYGYLCELEVNLDTIPLQLEDLLNAEWGDKYEQLETSGITNNYADDIEQERAAQEQQALVVLQSADEQITAQLQSHILHDDIIPDTVHQKRDKLHQYMVMHQVTVEHLRANDIELTAKNIRQHAQNLVS